MVQNRIMNRNCEAGWTCDRILHLQSRLIMHCGWRTRLKFSCHDIIRPREKKPIHLSWEIHLGVQRICDMKTATKSFL